EVEYRRSKLVVSRSYQAARLLRSVRQQCMDARIHTDEKWQCGQRYRTAIRPLDVQGAGEQAEGLRRKQRRLECDNLLLFRRRRSRAVALRVPNGRIHRLMRQVALKRTWIAGIGDLGSSRQR